jgi:membrane-associated phospholipid phosphatase
MPRSDDRSSVPASRRLIGLLVAAIVGFVAIARDVTHHGVLERQDVLAGRWVAGNTSQALVRVANVVTQVGNAWTLAGIAVLGVGWVLRRRNYDDVVVLVGAFALVALATAGLKLAFGRPRPSRGDLTPLPGTTSFPSGHTSGSVTVLVLLALLLATRHRRLFVAGAALLATLVGVTRVVVQAHWTTDVLAGYCLGTAIVAGALLVREQLSGRRSPTCARPYGESDRGDGGHGERDHAAGAFGEHRPHDLLPVGDLAEPQGG